MKGADIMRVRVLLSIRRVREALATAVVFAQERFVARVDARVNSHVLDARKSLSTVADFAAEGALASVRSVVIDELVAGAEAAFETRTSGPGAVVRFCRISSKEIMINEEGKERTNLSK